MEQIFRYFIGTYFVFDKMFAYLQNTSCVSIVLIGGRLDDEPTK